MKVAAIKTKLTNDATSKGTDFGLVYEFTGSKCINHTKVEALIARTCI